MDILFTRDLKIMFIPTYYKGSTSTADSFFKLGLINLSELVQDTKLKCGEVLAATY